MVLTIIAPSPMAVFRSTAGVAKLARFHPTAVLNGPMVLLLSAWYPTAVLLLPLRLLKSAFDPTVLNAEVLKKSALSPMAVLSLAGSLGLENSALTTAVLQLAVESL